VLQWASAEACSTITTPETALTFPYALLIFRQWACALLIFSLPTMQPDTDGPEVAGIKLFFAYFALLSYLIPLSLVVSLELVKVCIIYIYIYMHALRIILQVMDESRHRFFRHGSWSGTMK